MNDGLGALSADELRLLVREVLAEVVGKVPPAARGNTGQHGTSHDEVGLGGIGDAASWTVRISTDDDLHAFALRVLKLADNPKLRRDLIGGRIRFTLAGQVAGRQPRTGSTRAPSPSGSSRRQRRRAPAWCSGRAPS